MPTFTGRLGSKLPHVGTTIFTVMSRLAAEHNAINLSQGFPDFECAVELRALVTKYFNELCVLESTISLHYCFFF